MPNDNAIKFGMLKCRDLVELYYGARMVVATFEKSLNFGAGATIDILRADPRRIKYEIVVANTTVNPTSFQMGTPAADDASDDQFYSLPGNDNVIIQRDFFTDMDAVCLAIKGSNGGVSLTVSTRETFLTPIPVDEMP